MTSSVWDEVLAGHVRRTRAYAEQKLTFFDRYLPPAFRATQSKVTRCYVDLFAGPGVWEDRRSVRRLGSPLRALALSADAGAGHGFTDAFLVNLSLEDHRALSARVHRLAAQGALGIPLERIHLIRADANQALSDIMGSIHPRSWVFVYADIERPNHWPWSTVSALRAHGHESVDLYLLFPLRMALTRMLGYTARHPDALTRFFGCADWDAIAERYRKTDAQAPQFARALEALYARRLMNVGWRFVKRQRRVASRGERFMYHMLFATDHRAGEALSDWEAVPGGDERHRDQLDLLEP